MKIEELKLGDTVIVADENSLRYRAIGKIKSIDNVTFANKTRYIVSFDGREDSFFEESLKKKELIDKYLFTPQKAIAKLKQLLPDENQVIIGGPKNEKELELAIRMGIKALGKNITKKPTRKDLSESYKCPSCSEDRSWKDGRCCKDCGQLLDWRNK